MPKPPFRIQTPGFEQSKPVQLAAERLREGLALAYDQPPDADFFLLDVQNGLPPACGAPAEHGLDGPQAHRVIVTPRRVLLLGHGPLGVAYAVERFRRVVLELDPLAYWTGVPVRRANPALAHSDRCVRAPVFAHRIYFENDADELIHWSGRRLQLEWPVWKELIDTLVALGYSGVQPFDSVGRSEFFYWDHYRAEACFQLDEALMARVLSYIHDKGLLFKAHLALAWPFRRLDPSHTCWSRYADEWKAIWRYYLTESPLRQAEILAGSVGDPIWDGDYRCRCELCSKRDWREIQREYNETLLAMIHELAPGKVVTFGTYGMEAGDFRLRGHPDVVLEYSDRGYADFGALPEFPAGQAQAVYLHGGYWLDHTVLNPYVERIGAALRRMQDLGATRWVRANGQSFKPFLLNVEALSAAAWDPAAFDAAAFTRDWARQRWGEAAAEPFTAFCAALLDANEAVRTNTKERGYVQLLLGHVLPLFRELAGDDLAIPTINLAQCRDTASIFRCFPDAGSSPEHAGKVRDAARRAVEAAERLRQAVSESAARTPGTDPDLLFARLAVVEDQALFPARLFEALAAIYETQVRIRGLRARGPVPAAVLDELVAATRKLWDLHLEGPAHGKWREWYLPNRQRIFGVPPRPEEALAVRDNLRA